MFLGLPILISQVRLFNNTFSYKSNSFLDICSPGKCSDTGLEPCFPCPKGYFQPHPGLSFCYKCPHQVLQNVQETGLYIPMLLAHHIQESPVFNQTNRWRQNEKNYFVCGHLLPRETQNHSITMAEN
jgi:hypothetical protein